MKLQNVALAGLAVLAVAPAAFAGSSVTNSYSTRNIYNGRSNTSFSQYSYKNYRQYNNSVAVKAEAYGGDVNITNAGIDIYGRAYGTAHSSNRRVVDPVSIVTKSTQSEYVYGSDRTYVRGNENFSFTGTERSHTVSSDSF